MRDQILYLAQHLCETEDIEEARDLAGQLQRAVREHIEDLGTTLYWHKMRAAGEGHATNIVEMPRKQDRNSKLHHEVVSNPNRAG